MRTIAFDFDGVIHLYSKGWLDGTIYDTFIPGSIETIKHLMETYSVFIMSSRRSQDIEKKLNEVYPEIKTQVISDYTRFWNKMGVLGISSRKLPADVYIDDRALRFEGVFNKEFIDTIKGFNTWQKQSKEAEVV